MQLSKNGLLLVLGFPIFSLMALTAYKKHILSTGIEVVLPIKGYDPRDLLSGHFLIYRIDYGVEGICTGNQEQQTAYVCLEPKIFSVEEPVDCKKLIRGTCRNREFKAGIEKYFVAEEKALALEKAILNKSASIVVVLSPSGVAIVKELLVDGKSALIK